MIVDRMASIHILLDTLEKTKELGRALGSAAMPGEVISLDGDLGVGKTTLTQAIATGLEVSPEYYVNSPSFNIFHEYPGRIPLYHMDFYRLGTAEDVSVMGLDEYFYKDGLTVIEWAEKAYDILPEERLAIYLKLTGQQFRQARCTTQLLSWQTRLAEIANRVFKISSST